MNDISVTADGVARVVWAQPEALGAISHDVWSATFNLNRPLYDVQAAFDQSHSYKLGSVAPIRLRLLDANGINVSSSSLVLTATGLLQDDVTPASGVEEVGNSNPDSAFRYDEALQGYVFNLSTRNLSAGTWELQFTVSGDTTPCRNSSRDRSDRTVEL